MKLLKQLRPKDGRKMCSVLCRCGHEIAKIEAGTRILTSKLSSVSSQHISGACEKCGEKFMIRTATT